MTNDEFLEEMVRSTPPITHEMLEELERAAKRLKYDPKFQRECALDAFGYARLLEKKLDAANEKLKAHGLWEDGE